MQNLHKFSPGEQAKLLEVVEELEERKKAERARTSLLDFAQAMMPDYKIGPHHRQLAEYLEDLAHGRKDRVTVSIAPRFGKSQLTSIFFPAWFIGNWPDKKIMMVSHTSDLATDFGRKVRNLVGTPDYQRIFPDVKLSADSKSAGRWSTNKDGEYFACLRLHSKVHTEHGLVNAGDIRVGDHLLNSGRGATVQKIYRTQHSATYTVAGLECSADHPIWTENKGWVYARNIKPDDILIVESISDRLKAITRRAYGYLEHFHVSALVLHQVSLFKPKQPKVEKLWRARHNCLRSLAEVREFFGGYGRAAGRWVHSWAHRQQWAVQSGELSLGNPTPASQQPQNKPSGWRGDTGGAGQKTRGYAGSDSIPFENRGGPTERGEEAQEELWSYSPPKNKGWGRSIGVWLLKRGVSSVRQPSGSTKKYMAGFRRAAQNLSELLLGVRRAGKVAAKQHEEKPFVNFLLDGDHTFFADKVLTHNCGIGGAIAGRGAHLLVVDDPHNEQDILNGNFEVFDKAYEWYAYGARTRLMPGGSVAIVATRWAEQDLIGRVQKDMVRNEDSDQWEVVEFPALFENEHVSAEAPEEQKYISLWPEQWPVKSLLRTKASMPPFQWSAQYMQQPTSREASIVKREWWQEWLEDQPPPCEYIIMSLDAAAEKNTRADFTALTTWGVFYKDDENGVAQANIILLNSIKERLEFPELKRLAYDEYKEWGPDWFVIEKKSSGSPLFQEFRRAGVPVQEFTPHRGTGDKVMRLNSVSDMFASGFVWYPAGRRWAEEVVDEVCGFPAMPNDDLVDSTVMALMRFRSGGFIELPDDRWGDDEEDFEPVRAAYY